MWGDRSAWRAWLWGPQVSEFCSKDFPKVYGGFVDHLLDTLHARGPAASPSSTQQEPPPLRLPAVPRLVAIGDLHGDYDKARRAFRIAGLVDERDRWVGGTTTAVQVGDQLDRGGEEIRILYWLERLQQEAAQAGGALHILNGNHETLNMAGRFRYATMAGMQDFAAWSTAQAVGAALKEKCGCHLEQLLRPGPISEESPQDPQAAVRVRQAALAPGGPLARRFLAPHPIVLQIGSTVFVHGGVLPEHAAYGLEEINAETREWMLGKAGPMPRFLGGRDAVVWARDYSTEDERRCDCAALEQALGMMPGASRMVVGHTIQESGINSACANRVFRIDVGLSHGCGDGEPQVLEILDDEEVRSLRESKPPTAFVAPPGIRADAPAWETFTEQAWQWWVKERRKLAEVMSQQ